MAEKPEILYLECPRHVKKELKRVAKINHRSMTAQAIVMLEDGLSAYQDIVDTTARISKSAGGGS